MADNLTNTDANTTQYINANNFEELKTNLNDAFNKVVSNNFYKGAKGDSVKITRVSLKDSDNTLTTEGEKVYTVIFGDGADITDKHVAAIPTEWVGHPATPLFFVYHETTDDDVFTDYSCIIYATEMTDTGGYAYSKVDGFPTIYYNRTLKDYCWKVSGTETEISARYKDTSDKSVQFFLLKKITDTEFKYWDAEGNKWVDNLTSQTPTIGDYAYVLFKKTVSVAEVNTDVLALGFAVYNSDGWKEIAYGDDLTAVTYNDAYMSYIWNTIYTSLGQEYPAEPISADMDETIDPNKSFHLPDVTTDGEYFHNITAISNSDRSDIVVSPKDYGNTSKEYAVIFDGYEGVYTKGRDTGPDDNYKLVTKTELDGAIEYTPLKADDYKTTKTYGKVKITDISGKPGMTIYTDLTPKTPNVAGVISGIAVQDDELFDIKYNPSTKTITWMKDQYGNEATWDFVNNLTFIYRHLDPSMGSTVDFDIRKYFRNTIFNGTANGLQGMQIIVYDTVQSSTTIARVPDIVGANNRFNCLRSDGNYSALTICIDSSKTDSDGKPIMNDYEIISNNVITASKLNITLGIKNGSSEDMYALYNSSDTELNRCVFNNNVITNSNVTLSAYRMSDNTIINSTISGINTVWLYLPKTALSMDATSKPTYSGCDYDDNLTGSVTWQRQIRYVDATANAVGVKAYRKSALYDLRSIDNNKFIGCTSANPLVFVITGLSQYTSVAAYATEQLYNISTVITGDNSTFYPLVNYNHDLTNTYFSGISSIGITSTKSTIKYTNYNSPSICIDDGTTNGIALAIVGFADIRGSLGGSLYPVSDIYPNNRVLILENRHNDISRKKTYEGDIVNIRGYDSTEYNNCGQVQLVIGDYISLLGNMLHMASWDACKNWLTILQ